MQHAAAHCRKGRAEQRGAALGRCNWARRATCGLAGGTLWGCAGAQLAAALERSLGLRWGATCGCAGEQRGVAHGRSVDLRMGGACGGAGVQHAAAHGRKMGCAGGSMELRWRVSAARGAQPAAKSGTQCGAARRRSMRRR